MHLRSISIHALEQHSLAWNAYADELGLPMARTEWVIPACRHLCNPATVKVIILTDEQERLRAGAALALSESGRLDKYYELAGTSRLYEPATPVYKDISASNDLMRALRRLNFPTVMQRYWPYSTELHTESAFTSGCIQITRRSAPSQYLPITGSYSELQNSISSQRRYDLRRARRRADNIGKVEFELQRPSADEVADMLASAADVEASSWKGERGSALRSNEDSMKFFEEMLTKFAEHNNAYFAFLHINGSIAAMQIGLDIYKSYWILKIGYDPAYAKCSPGLILMDELIQAAFASRYTAVEFLGSSEPWIHTWSPLERSYQTVMLYPYRPYSLLQLSRQTARSLTKRFLLPT